MKQKELFKIYTDFVCPKCANNGNKEDDICNIRINADGDAQCQGYCKKKE